MMLCLAQEVDRMGGASAREAPQRIPPVVLLAADHGLYLFGRGCELPRLPVGQSLPALCLHLRDEAVQVLARLRSLPGHEHALHRDERTCRRQHELLPAGLMWRTDSPGLVPKAPAAV